VKDQFMLGPSMLVAPVLVDKARSRKVYLPEAGTTWFDYVSGARYDGGKTHTVKADLDQIPIFAPAGAIIPTFETEVDTLDRVTSPGIKDLDDAEAGTLGLQLYASSTGYNEQTLYDGTTVSHFMVPTGSKDLVVQAFDKDLPTCPASGQKKACVELGATRTLTAHLGPTKGFSLVVRCSGENCFTAFVSSPRSRRFKVTLRW
jgi:hypothetical protein